jgi:hypothetical protein
MSQPTEMCQKGEKTWIVFEGLGKPNCGQSSLDRLIIWVRNEHPHSVNTAYFINLIQTQNQQILADSDLSINACGFFDFIDRI